MRPRLFDGDGDGALVAQGGPGRASMRPRLFDGDGLLIIGVLVSVTDASMRPRLFDGDGSTFYSSLFAHSYSFNEAPSLRRGWVLQPKRCRCKHTTASMRPRLFDGDGRKYPRNLS